MPEPIDPDAVIQEVEGSLGEVERRLLQGVRDGSQGTAALSEVIDRIAGVIVDLRPPYRRVHEILERRDIPLATTEHLETLRSRILKLYRKSRLEHMFFLKLQLERSLRDTLHHHVVKSFEEMSALDEHERTIRTAGEAVLVDDLLGDDGQLELPVPDP